MSASDARVETRTAPTAGPEHFRSSLGAYQEACGLPVVEETAGLARNERTRTLVFGPIHRIICPRFDLMASPVLPQHVGPFLLRDCGHVLPWEAPHAMVSGTAAFAADLVDLSRGTR